MRCGAIALAPWRWPTRGHVRPDGVRDDGDGDGGTTARRASSALAPQLGFAGLSAAETVSFAGLPRTTRHAAPALRSAREAAAARSAPPPEAVPLWLTLPKDEEEEDDVIMSCGVVYFHGNGETRATAWGAALKVHKYPDKSTSMSDKKGPSMIRYDVCIP